MDFLEWIDLVGAENVANMVDVSVESVYLWKRAETAPRVMLAHALIEKSHHVLTWESIYVPYVQNKLNKENPNQLKLNL